MADLISSVSKISTRAKVWVVGFGLAVAFIWPVDTGTAPGTQVVPPVSQAVPSVQTIPAPSPPTKPLPAPTPESIPASKSKGAVTAAEIARAKAQAQAPTAESLELTGTYSGIVHNITAGISADFGILVTESRGSVQGCMDVKPPLVGSGPLRGAVNGSKVSFVVASDLMQIAFDGHREAANLNGTYVVSAKDGGAKETGTFTLQKISPEGLIKGFNIANCSGDLARVSASANPARSEKTVPTLQLSPTAPSIATPLTPSSTPVTRATERPRSAPAGYFTVGSTKDEVLTVQGTPTGLSDYQWAYGLSHVSFQSGRVTGWYVSPVNALRVKMLPNNETAASAARARGYFTVGSTKDEVLAVQGTPTSFGDYQWAYGLSHVSFQSDMVTGWYVSPVNALRVKMLPNNETAASAARARGYFTVGSTKDEVLAVQGTPTTYSETQWGYGLSHVSFQGDKVATWYVSPVNVIKVALPNK